MKKKAQKPKSNKIKKGLNIYSLNESLNLIGKKVHGNDWLFEDWWETSGSENQAKSLQIFRITELLALHNFFDVHNSEGQIISPVTQIIFVKDNKINEEFKIPKTQLDYVLKTQKRFCDQKKTKFIKPVIYTAILEDGISEIKSKFNKREANKIKDQVIIKDFGYWIKKNDLDRKHVYLILLGVNPDYYEFLLPDERESIDRNLLFTGNDRINIYLNNVEILIEDFKHVIWENDWKKLIRNLYIKSPIINSTFATRCNNFIKYVYDKKLFPNCFDKYLNHNLYRPNYDEYFEKEQTLEHEDVAFLAMGLEPKYAKEFLEYEEIIDNDSQKRYSALGNDEKIFFYKCYRSFLDEYLIVIGRQKLIMSHGVYAGNAYTGNLENFIDNLHNKGFLLNEYLLAYLKRKKKFPTYKIDSDFYRTLKFCSQMRYWKFEDIYNLIMDKNPIDGEQIIFPLGLQCGDGFNVYKTDKNKSYSIRLKSRSFCDIEKIDQFYSKEGEGYKPQDVVEWLIKYTFVGLPELLVDLVFENNKKKLDELKKMAKNNNVEAIKLGRRTKIPYPKVWEIFITEILGGDFDESNPNHAQQAKIAFDKLDKPKQNSLCKTAKSNFIIDIMARCQNKEIEIKPTSIAEKIVEPFEKEFSKEFFQ